MTRLIWILGAANGFLAVAFGAFAAHKLRDKLEPRLFEIFEVAARYQMYHALALLAAAWLTTRSPSPTAVGAAWCFFIGIVLFSGSLYALSLTGIKPLGIITPFGGVAFLAGWVLLAVAGSSMK